MPVIPHRDGTKRLLYLLKERRAGRGVVQATQATGENAGGGAGVDPDSVVTSVAKSGGTQLTGDVTLSEGAGIELTVTDSNIAIASTVSLPSFDFGDGSDGNITVSTSIALSRDMFYDELVVENGGTIDTNGFKIFALTSVTIETGGLIHNNGAAGNNGGNATGRVGGTAGAQVDADSLGSIMNKLRGVAGQPGGNGGTNANGTAGTAGTDIFSGGDKGFGAAGATGGAAGAGGNAAPNTGGTAGGAGTAFAPDAIPALAGGVRHLLALTLWRYFDYDTPAFDFFIGNNIPSGSGSGGGGASSLGVPPAEGGGGGGSASSGQSAGAVYIASPIIDGASRIEAKGGAGGDGGDGGNGSNPGGGNAGGGGGGAGGSGGSGGIIVLVAYSIVGVYSSAQVAGGAGGGGGAFGTGVGTGANGVVGGDGNAGTNGFIFVFN